jgi:hypothetical protein
LRTFHFLLLVLLGRALVWSAPAPGELTIDVAIVDQSGQPVPDVQVQLRTGQEAIPPAGTDASGHARFTALRSGLYEVTAAKEGFEPARKGDLDLSKAGSISVELTMIPSLARHDSVEVQGTVSPVEQGATTSTELQAKTAKALPSRPATVADALPLIPGVVRNAEGRLQISGSGEHRSALIVNSADVTDPATGLFGLTVPIDSVETMNVLQTPFLAEYGRFTAGLVSVETRRGGDKWKWELNDPFPDFRIRSYHMQGIRDATPRLNVEGPIIPGKLYFSEGLEYEIRKTPVITLPFPNNQTKKAGVNSFAQLDWVASDRQLVTGTVHIAPQRLEFVNLNYFNPQPVSPDAATHNYTGTLADRLTVGGGLFENTLSVTRFDARVWAQGIQDLTITPSGNFGNYFAGQNRDASRFGWLSTYSLAPLTRAGTHNIKIGSYFASSVDRGDVTERPVSILDSNQRLIERILFAGGAPFLQRDSEMAFFGQDHWIVTPRLAIDLGLRTESQEVTDTFRVAPRAGIAWSPLPHRGTVVRAGYGWFYDRVPLSVFAFHQYPNQVVSYFDGSGNMTGGPFLYENLLGEVHTRSPFIFRELQAGNFSPQSATWSVQVEQPLSHAVRVRASYMQNSSSGLVIMDPVTPDPITRTGALLLTGTGQSRYRQFELTTRVRLAGERELFFSYVRSRARGDLNDFANYLGSFPVPIVRGNQFGNLQSDLPNRFLAWGVVKLPAGFRIAPIVEYRSGFPYAVTDAAQNYFGVPYLNRYPNFLAVDSRFSKDFQVNPKYAVRLSISGFNLTNHFNPEAFHANIADAAFGTFFGTRHRHFTADFDVLF